ncbi:MAG: germination protein YpeB, partial [Oscillospiraceae bacterium]
NTYSRCLEDLSAGLNNINLTLEKGAYCSTATQLSMMATELWRQAGISKSALSQLPAPESELTNINRFLSQVGDYSLFLSKKLISNDKITEDERDNLFKLGDVAINISQGISEIRMKYEDGGMWTNEISAGLTQVVNNDSFSMGITELEKTVTDYPTLVYDGPFSDHMLNGTPKMLGSGEIINRDKARKEASDALNLDIEIIKDDTDEEGKMPSYGFKTDDTVISVTKQGGHVVYFRKTRAVSEQNISYDQAIKKAKEYLSMRKKTTFQETYYFTDEGVCVINFAHKEGATVCYPDLLKIGVALDTGEILFYEGRGFIMNHYRRTIPTPKYSPEEAKAVLSPILKVESYKQAVIPSSGEKEKYCWEFKTMGINHEEILVFINWATLQEEDIIILLKTDGGTLAK